MIALRTLRLGSECNDVAQLQSILHKLGIYPGNVDGIFGTQTQSAVKEFQKMHGLSPDGVVGSQTWKAVEPYLRGYDAYTIKPGDTFYLIGQKYAVDPALIAVANPDIDPQNLAAGAKIAVPFSYGIVMENTGYTYEVLERNVQGLKVRYPFLHVGAVGSSVLGKTLFALRFGRGPHHVLYNAAHHALEWITSPVLMKFTEDFLRAYALGVQIGGYNPREIWDSATIWIIPMVNPDGVDLVINGLQPDNPYYSQLIRWNGGSSDFSSNWEANIRGVDLNHNYDAAWEESKQAEAALGITGPGPTRYSGPYPASEPETRAMVNFTRDHDIGLAMAYHAQGRVIYWNFQDMASPEAETIGRQLSLISGYSLEEATGVSSYAGYKDWFIKNFRRPGYTIEVGSGKNPLPVSQFPEIYMENLGMLLYAASTK